MVLPWHRGFQLCPALIIANLAAELLAGAVLLEIGPDPCSVPGPPWEELQEEYSVMTTGVKITHKEEGVLTQ